MFSDYLCFKIFYIILMKGGIVVISDFVNQYASTILYTVLMAIITWVGMQIKIIIKAYVNNQIIKDVIKMVCQAIEQLHNDLSGEKKLNLAIDNSKAILEAKGIKLSDLELRIFIESTVKCFKEKGG